MNKAMGNAEIAERGFARPVSFWVGAAGVLIGVLGQLPMYVSARSRHFMLRGMPMDPAMLVGMVLMAVGFVLVCWGVGYRGLPGGSGSRGLSRLGDLPHVRALDDVRIGPAHIRLMVVLTAAIAIDSLKPYTLTFILPGVAKEYGLSSPVHHIAGHQPVALLAFWGILGTAAGSFIWGYLGDRVGRRASILIASVLFVATSACSAMPNFWQNELMCLVMGIAVGGFLPITYALLVETVPSRVRGPAVVLIGGIGTALGFLMASAFADWLIPSLGWRIMWLLGIPSGVALILLNREIPESPRFLSAIGEDGEAKAIMERFGSAMVAPLPWDAAGTQAAQPPDTLLGTVADHRSPARGRDRLGLIVSRPYRLMTPALTLYGIAFGIVNFGFLVWLPIDLAHAQHGVHGPEVTVLLAKAAFFSIPGAVLAAWLYGRSAKKAMVVFAATSALSLGVFWAFGSEVVASPTLFTVVLVALLVSMWGSISVLCPYSAEVYPTAVRATGAGLAAGASKVGGVLALAMAVLAITPPDLTGAALMSAMPMLLAAVVVGIVGVETAGRPLDSIARRDTEMSPALR